jgi:hypothetical protein
MKILNIIGKRFGKLIAIERLDLICDNFGGKRYQWKFLCDCGNEYIAIGSSVKKGRIKSCGCNKNNKDKNGNWKGYMSISGSVLGHYKKHAIRRNIEFNVDIEYLYEILQKQGNKCPYSGIELLMERKDTYCRTTINASLDRIDSNKGYIKGNIQWVYTPINFMKGTLSHEEFINLCGLIHNNVEKQIIKPLSKDLLKNNKTCCGHGCINCPYEWRNVKEPKRTELLNKKEEL